MTHRTSPSVLRASPAAIQHILNFEGFIPYPYWDKRPKRGGGYEEWQGGVWSEPTGRGTVTIGYGSTMLTPGRRITVGMRLDKATALQWLTEDLARVYEPELRRLVKVPLAQHEYDALVGFIYNVGGSQFERSTLRKVLNQRQYDKVPRELMKWVHSGGEQLRGLVRRRRAEAEMWRGLAGETHDDVVNPEPKPRGPEVEPPKAPSPIKDGEGLTSIIGLISTLAGALTDWRIAAVIAPVALAVIAYFVWKRTREQGA